MKDKLSGTGRLVKNTLLLYVRMAVLMIIGLYTSRVVLRSLGASDYGVYNAVAGVVTMFTLVTTSISQSISRFLAVGLGGGDKDRLRRIFSTSVLIQLLFCAVVLILTETLGLWYVNHRMVLPPDRLPAAGWVLQCSMGLLMLNLLSVPFNATIIAHEKMDAFAYISILEAGLKLAVALAVAASPIDRLKTYALLMLVAGVVVRSTYAAYCRRFEETRGGLVFDRGLLREMTGFAGWNFLGSGAMIINTQGVNQLSNIFFGVTINAARGLALNVESMVKQFASSFLNALNPQILKSFANGDRDRSLSLVSKGSKFSFLLMLLICIPVELEAPLLLRLWLRDVPEWTVLFTRLALLGVLVDLVCNPLVTLIQATGRIRGYYIASSAVSLLTFVLSWVAFAHGAPAYAAYVFFIGIYALLNVVKIVAAHRLAGFPVGAYLGGVLLRVLAVAVLSSVATFTVWFFMPAGGWRLVSVLAMTVLSLGAFTWLLALSRDEKDFAIDWIRGRLGRVGR